MSEGPRRERAGGGAFGEQLFDLCSSLIHGDFSNRRLRYLCYHATGVIWAFFHSFDVNTHFELPRVPQLRG